MQKLKFNFLFFNFQFAICISLSTIAYAQGGAERAAQGILSALFPIILLFLIFYFLLLRPQMKKGKVQREMWANLKKGDHVITAGGLHGKITGVTDTVVTLEIADKVRVKISKDKVMEIVKKTDQEKVDKSTN